MAKKQNESTPTAGMIAKFKLLRPLLLALQAECRELSKKKPDGALNKFKVDVFNRVLKDVKEVLGKEPAIGYLDLLDDTALPHNSDAVMVLSQFATALDQFKSNHHNWNGTNYGWDTVDGRIQDRDESGGI